MRKGIFIPLMLIVSSIWAQSDLPDNDMMQKIKNEGLNHSQVMDIAFHLTDANGPRLMQSPGYTRAANWAKNKLVSWGLTHADIEAWGKWGKGWELEKYYLAMTAPYYKPLIGFPKTFSKGTSGPAHAMVVLFDPADTANPSNYHGQLAGKLLIIKRKDALTLGFAPDATRYTDAQLKELAEFDPKKPVTPDSNYAKLVADYQSAAKMLSRVKQIAREEGALGILTTGTKNSDGTVFVQNGIPYDVEMNPALNDIAISMEDFLTTQRLLEHQVPVEVDLELKTRIYDEDLQGHNVIAEIEGTDKKLKEELVMIGAHLDSWQGSTGATDNAAGSAVMMEAIRILKTIGFKPRRTIRIALWGGEENGIHGSKNYVKNHFTDTVTKKINAEGDKLSVYFNLDNGTGKIRGIYLQGNTQVKPIFENWFLPFNDLGANTVTLKNTGGTDHLSFDAIGLPGFQFIQDPMEYGPRTHHSNMDSYDHLSEADMKQAATIIAAFVYNAAQRNEKIPRK